MANKKKSARDIALEKMDFLDDGSSKKKKDKISGRKKKSGFKRFLASAFPQSEDSGGEKARKVFLLAAVCALIGALFFLGWQIISVSLGGDLNKKLADIAGSPMEDLVHSTPDYIANPTATLVTAPGDKDPEYMDLTPLTNTPLNVDFASLKAQNPDVRAWIKITGTMVNNPVMQSTDNDYYLKHDFYGNESVSGAIFSSYLNKWDGTDENIILYGHNMMSGDFFAYVVHYVPDDSSKEPIAFYKVHPTIMLATPDGGSQTYKIFAGMIANTEKKYGEVFKYTKKTNFTDVDDFNTFVSDIMDRSWFYTDVDITYGDQLLTLSTCYWPLGRDIETRWVLFARKVRPGESEEVDTSVAYRNYNAKLFDYYYEMIGGYWAGSTWDKSKLLSLY